MQQGFEHAVEQQVERIRNSPDFANGAKLGQFLNYVVEQTLAGNPGKIKQYTIAVEALGYPPDFDPMNNPTVRILAGRLRRAIDRYYIDQGKSDPIRIDIPKGSYIPVFSGVETAAEATARSSVARRSPASAARQTQHPTIAVYEFQCGGDGQMNPMIAVGLSAEILVAMTRFADLSVVGPLSRSQGSRDKLKTLLGEQGAAFALQGSIRSSGQKIRITTDLVDTATGVCLWGHTFKYDLDSASLFDIEDEVTSRIAGAIGDGLGVIFRRLQSDSYRQHIKQGDVTDAVLSYNYAWAIHTPQSFLDAYEAVGEALEIHPKSALLTALQANILYGDALHGLGIAADSATKMVEMADQAVALDPNLQVARYNEVVVNAFYGRADACIEAARHVVALNPNHARILAGCAIATASVGAYELGKELIEQAKHLNPQYPGIYYFVDFVINFREGRYDEAWANAKLIETPGIIWQPLIRAAALGELGRVDEAKTFLDEVMELKPDFRERGRDYIRRLFVTDEHVDMICDGLSRCQIQVPAVTP